MKQNRKMSNNEAAIEIKFFTLILLYRKQIIHLLTNKINKKLK